MAKKKTQAKKTRAKNRAKVKRTTSKISGSELVKILILESSYDSKRDVIIWDVRFLDFNQERRLVWRSIDLFTALNVNIEVLNKFPDKKVELLEKFCRDVKGTTKNLELHSICNSQVPNRGKGENETIDYISKVGEIVNSYDYLPFEEIKSIEAERLGITPKKY